MTLWQLHLSLLICVYGSHGSAGSQARGSEDRKVFLVVLRLEVSEGVSWVGSLDAIFSVSRFPPSVRTRVIRAWPALRTSLQRDPLCRGPRVQVHGVLWHRVGSGLQRADLGEGTRHSPWLRRHHFRPSVVAWCGASHLRPPVSWASPAANTFIILYLLKDFQFHSAVA